MRSKVSRVDLESESSEQKGSSSNKLSSGFKRKFKMQASVLS